MFDWLKKLLGRDRQPTTPPDPNAPPKAEPAKASPRWVDVLRWAIWIGMFVAAVGGFVLQWKNDGKLPPLPDIPPPPIQQAGPSPDGPPSYSMGWTRDDAATEAVADSLTFKTFADTPAGQDDAPLPRAVYLWHAYRKLTGKNPPVRNQNPTGSCVAHGTNRAIERTMEVAVANGANYELRRFVEEVTYAGSRVNIGKGRIRGDGSVGAWAAKFVVEYGALPETTVGRYDLTKYDADRCRQWGYNGIPADVMAEAKKYPVGDATRVTTWAGAKKAMANGSAIAVCSDVGFNKPGTMFGFVEPAARDANGCCKPNGEWAHCMCIDGYHTDDAGKEWAHVENSWGPNAHTGPVGWGEPNTSGFWTDAATAERMIKQEAWTFSAVKGFPKKRVELDWFVRTQTRRQFADQFALALAP